MLSIEKAREWVRKEITGTQAEKKILWIELEDMLEKIEQKHLDAYEKRYEGSPNHNEHTYALAIIPSLLKKLI